jgi:hypothetical protein
MQYWKDMHSNVEILLKNLSLGHWSIQTLDPTLEQWAAYCEGRLQFVDSEPVILDRVELPERVKP